MKPAIEFIRCFKICSQTGFKGSNSMIISVPDVYQFLKTVLWKGELHMSMNIFPIGKVSQFFHFVNGF